MSTMEPALRVGLPLRLVVRVVIRRGTKICLTIKKKDGRVINYNVPGGGVEDGDSLEKTAIKECLEEVGIRVCDLKPLNVNLAAHHPMSSPERNERWGGTNTFYYVAEYEADDKSLYGSAGDALYYEWVEIKQAIRMIEDGIRDQFTATKLAALKAVARIPVAKHPTFLEWK